MTTETATNSKRNRSWQKPIPKLYKVKGRPGIWKTRYRRYNADGTSERPWEILGDSMEFPTRSAVMASAKYDVFIKRINYVRTVVFFSDLARMYKAQEISQRVPHGQKTAEGQLAYLVDEWGKYRLDQLMLMKYDIRTWLQSDELRLRSKPEVEASRQTRRHLRTMLVSMMNYAVDKHYMPYNPFTGTSLTVKKGGAPPVDRSEFYVAPEMFRFMMNDPETPGHVKMMIRIAYTTGMREEEFLALKWEVIDFDTAEPKISIVRTVNGKHIREATKSENSKTPVPMCDLLGAALLIYKDEYPSVEGWLFGSIRTKRPMWSDSLREDYLRPALRRMVKHFRLGALPEGTGFHAFRHAYNALIVEASKGRAATSEQIKEVQIKLLRQGGKEVNDRYGKSALPIREQARRLHAAVADLVMGNEVKQ